MSTPPPAYSCLVQRSSELPRRPAQPRLAGTTGTTGVRPHWSHWAGSKCWFAQTNTQVWLWK